MHEVIKNGGVCIKNRLVTKQNRVGIVTTSSEINKMDEKAVKRVRWNGSSSSFVP
jgi:hypothetical protein